MIMDMPTREHRLSTDRLEALADGIFAFAMTLLVLTIDMPTSVPRATANQAISEHLINLLPQFWIYALAFLTLGGFWYGHQRQFHFIKHVDARLLWANLMLMMLVALIPFTTNLAGDYGDFQIGVLPMEMNLLMIALIFSYQWFYAVSRPELLRYELSPSDVARSKERQVVQIAISLVPIGISFFSPAWSTLPYILLPYLYVHKRYRLIE